MDFIEGIKGKIHMRLNYKYGLTLMILMGITVISINGCGKTSNNQNVQDETIELNSEVDVFWGRDNNPELIDGLEYEKATIDTIGPYNNVMFIEHNDLYYPLGTAQYKPYEESSGTYPMHIDDNDNSVVFAKEDYFNHIQTATNSDRIVIFSSYDDIYIFKAVEEPMYISDYGFSYSEDKTEAIIDETIFGSNELDGKHLISIDGKAPYDYKDHVRYSIEYDFYTLTDEAFCSDTKKSLPVSYYKNYVEQQDNIDIDNFLFTTDDTPIEITIQTAKEGYSYIDLTDFQPGIYTLRLAYSYASVGRLIDRVVFRVSETSDRASEENAGDEEQRVEETIKEDEQNTEQINSNNDDEIVSEQESEENYAIEEKESVSSVERYKKLLDDYCVAFSDAERDDYESVSEFMNKYGIYGDGFWKDSRDKYGYTFKDIDGDGEDELLVGEDNSIRSVFTIRDGEYYNLINGWSRNWVMLLDDNTFYSQGSGGAAIAFYCSHKLSDDGLEEVYDEIYKWDSSEYDQNRDQYGDINAYEDDRFWFYTDDGDIDSHNYKNTTYLEAKAFIEDHTSREMVLEYTPFKEYEGLKNDEYSSDKSIMNQDKNSDQDNMDPFYGIWCYASKNPDDADEYSRELQEQGYNCDCLLTSTWENLNSESYYAITLGRYYSEEDAKQALERYKSDFPDCYVKYTGVYLLD